MPAPAAMFRHLSRMGVRDRRSTVELSIVVGGVSYDRDTRGLPIRGYYGERDVVETVQNREVMVSEPWVILCREELPVVPKRGDVIVFDDGPLVVADQPKDNGAGSIELALTRKGVRAGR